MHFTRSTTRTLRGGRIVKRDSLVKVKQQPKATKTAPKEEEEPPKEPIQQHKMRNDHLTYLKFLRQITIQMKKKDQSNFDCPSFRQTQKVIRLNLLHLIDALNACLLLGLKYKDDPMLYERKHRFEMVYRRIFLHPFPPHVKTPFQKGLAKFWNRGLELLRIKFLENDYDESLRIMHGLYSFITNIDLKQPEVLNELMFDMST